MALIRNSSFVRCRDVFHRFVGCFHNPRWKIVALWLGWLFVCNTFQVIAFARITPIHPDFSYAWSAAQTQAEPPSSNPIKLHVRWDSGFYVTIALYGYDSVNAAFFPLYPLAMRTVNNLLLLSLTPQLSDVDRMELAGFLVSVAASLGAALGLYEILLLLLGDTDARRGVFYFLIYPPAIFLLQVYSEPLFLALATWCIALILRRRWWLAGLVAALATLDRSTGIVLLVPLMVTWLLDWRAGARPAWRTLLVVAGPLITWRFYFAWLRARALSVVVGQGSFGRWLLPPNPFALFGDELSFVTNNPQATVHITIDVLLTLLAIGSSVRVMRRWPAIGLFGLAAIVLPLLTFRVVGLDRYTLSVLPIYLVLAMLGHVKV